MGSRAIVLGQTEAGAATDHAIIKANEGISVVEVDNGSFAVHRSLSSFEGMERQRPIDTGFPRCSGRGYPISSLGSDFGSDQRSRYRHSYNFGRWKAQYRCFPEPVGLRIGGVDVSRAAWYSGPRACLNVSEKVTVPTFKVMAEEDKYFELSSHPRSGAMVIHSVEGNTATLYRLSLDVTPARLRSSMWHPALYELVGGNDELAVSVPQIKFVGGMRMTEIVKVSS
jgi:hypothetical protein